MLSRNDRKREDIISTALKEWGKSHFRKTSLSTLARGMGITKPALYRYFSSKDDLNHAIEERVRDEYCRLGRRFLEGSRELNLESTFRLYTDTHLRYFCEHPDMFYYFVISALKEPFLNHAEVKDIHSREIHRIGRLIEGSTLGWGYGDSARILRYAFSTCSFWLHAFLHLRNGFSAKGMLSSYHSPLSNEQQAMIIRDASDAVLRGLGGKDFRDDLPFESMESQCRVSAEEMPEKNRIFESISEVVAEEGLGKTTLEKIAQKAGMTKSSLYFYFRNKDDMLGSMLNRERDRIDTIFEQRARLYKSTEEKIYSRFLVTASYHINNATLMTAFSWFHYQGIVVHLQPPSKQTLEKSTAFLQEAITSGRLRGFSLEPFHILFYINSLILNEIFGKTRSNPPLPLTLKDMRRAFRYFSRGVLWATNQEE